MASVFKDTTSLLSADFVDKFSAEKLTVILNKLSQEIGIEFTKTHSSFCIIGDWDKVAKAYARLDEYVVKNEEVKSDGEEEKSKEESYENGDGKEELENSEEKSDPEVNENQDQSKPNNNEEGESNDEEEETNGDEVRLIDQETQTKRFTNKQHEEYWDQIYINAETQTEGPGLVTIKEELDNYEDAYDEDGNYIGTNPTKQAAFNYANDFLQYYVKVERELLENDDGAENVVTPSKSAKKKGPKSGGGSSSAVKKPPGKRIRKQRTEEKLSDVPLKCDKCSYVGNRLRNFKDHVKRMHGNKFQCDKCSKWFGVEKDLLTHIRRVHEKGPYHCMTCSKSFKFEPIYKIHVLSHEENFNKMQCDICQKTFGSKYSLTRHLKIEHFGMKKTFLCPTCGKSFTHKEHYMVHMNIHAGIKPYVCDICGKEFAYQATWKDHKYMHYEERRFSCEICGKTFRQSSGLRKHMAVHKDTKDHICTSCGKAFRQKNCLVRHERIHSGARPYTCAICQRTFKDPANIRRHMILKHKKGKDPASWRPDVLCSLKKKSEYFIQVMSSASSTTTSTVTNTVASSNSTAMLVENAIKELENTGDFEDNTNTRMSNAKSGQSGQTMDLSMTSASSSFDPRSNMNSSNPPGNQRPIMTSSMPSFDPRPNINSSVPSFDMRPNVVSTMSSYDPRSSVIPAMPSFDPRNNMPHPMSSFDPRNTMPPAMPSFDLRTSVPSIIPGFGLRPGPYQSLDLSMTSNPNFDMNTPQFPGNSHLHPHHHQ